MMLLATPENTCHRMKCTRTPQWWRERECTHTHTRAAVLNVSVSFRRRYTSSAAYLPAVKRMESVKYNFWQQHSGYCFGKYRERECILSPSSFSKQQRVFSGVVFRCWSVRKCLYIYYRELMCFWDAAGRQVWCGTHYFARHKQTIQHVIVVTFLQCCMSETMHPPFRSVGMNGRGSVSWKWQHSSARKMVAQRRIVMGIKYALLLIPCWWSLVSRQTTDGIGYLIYLNEKQ